MDYFAHDPRQGRQLTDNVERSLAQSLADGIKQHKYKVGHVPKHGDGSVHVKRVLHVPIHKARRVNEGDQGELLLLGGGDLCCQKVHEAFGGKRGEYAKPYDDAGLSSPCVVVVIGWHDGVNEYN